MEPKQELRERQRLFVPARSAVRLAGKSGAGQGAGPARPWTSDHPWNPEGQEPDYPLETGRPVVTRLIAVAVIGLCNLGLLTDSLLLENIIVILDLVGIVILADALLKLWQASRRLRPRMRWKTFPAFTGGRLEAVLVMRPAQEPIAPVRAVLRCVRDERVVRGQEGGDAVSFEPVAVYRQIAEIPVPGDKLRELPLAFEIPPDLPGTDLGREEATYWQIALLIRMVGPDLESVFLAPVYNRGES